MSEIQQLEINQNKESIIGNLGKASLQTAFGFLIAFLPNTISISLLESQNETLQVGAMGLGILITQAIGMGILCGMATGLETLVSQAYGANQFKLCAKLFYLSLIVCHVMMLPIALFLFFSGELLSMINNKQELIQETAKFNKWIIIGVYSEGIFLNVKAFLNGQNIYNYQFYTQIITGVIFIILSYLLVVKYNLGIVGCAISMTCQSFLNNLILFTFIVVTKCCNKTYYKFKISYLHSLGRFLKEAIPIGLILWLQWISYESYVLLTSYLQSEVITTHVLMTTFSGFVYQFSYGISIASTTFVGNEMGRKEIEMAKLYTKATFLLEFLFLFILLCPMAIFWNDLIPFVSKDRIVIEELHHLLYLLMLHIALDGIQAILSGLVRAIGREKSTSITFLLCYLVLGQLLGYLFGYTLNYGLFGIWAGITIGVLSFNIIQFINLVWKDWNILAEEISVKLSSINQKHIVDDDDEEI